MALELTVNISRDTPRIQGKYIDPTTRTTSQPIVRQPCRRLLKRDTFGTDPQRPAGLVYHLS